MLKEKEEKKKIEKEKEQAENEREMERKSTVAVLNKDIMFMKDSIKCAEETIREGSEDIAKALKGKLKKQDIQKAHTIIQMSLDRKRNLENTLSELEAKKSKLDK